MTTKEIKLSDKLFLNVKESCLTNGSAALENAYQNELGGISRFPGLTTFATLAGKEPTYLHEWHGDLIAVSSSRTWRVDKDGNTYEATGIQISGGKRVIFDRTPNELMMAAGGPIVRLAAAQTELLSPDAPESTHVAYIGGYAVAIETNTGLFYTSQGSGDYQAWNALDVFAADSRPDFINSMIITPYNEIMLAGIDSIEQWEKLPFVSTPQFQRRWAIGEGTLSPYTLTFADNGLWSLNKNREFVRSSGQVSKPVTDDIGRVIEPLNDEADAWATPILIGGQKFVLLQFPYATNVYGTPGVTLLFDYRQGKWFSLYGWDADLCTRKRWPGWSHYQIWGRHFVGGDGEIYELKNDVYSNEGLVQKVFWRSGNLDYGNVRMDNISLRLKRGLANSNATRSKMSIRVAFDGKPWTKWCRQDLGRYGENASWIDFGEMGSGDTFQIEVDMTDATEFELIKMKVDLTPLNES
jgi:hypothetical protein